MALISPSIPAGGAPVRPFLHRFSRRRDLADCDPLLASSGSLEARLATRGKEVRRAQKLRYRVFFEEGGAIPDRTSRLIRRDVCRFDRVADHLIVIDKTTTYRDGSPRLVGVYRLLRQEEAERNFGFYSAGEFDVEALIARRPDLRFLEVGRACIAPTHRGKHVLELLWRGLWAYAQRHRIDAMIGCASLPGADAAVHAGAIAALSAGGDPAWRVAPRADRIGAGAAGLGAEPADPRALLRVLPPLVKGYWRLGATFSPSPAVDRAFNTTDLFVVMPLSEIEGRYLDYFGVEFGRPAARGVKDARSGFSIQGFPSPRNSVMQGFAGGPFRRRDAPVAQLDRALPSEGKGHTFESCRARQHCLPNANFRAPGGRPRPRCLLRRRRSRLDRSQRRLEDAQARHAFRVGLVERLLAQRDQRRAVVEALDMGVGGNFRPSREVGRQIGDPADPRFKGPLSCRPTRVGDLGEHV